MVDNYSKIMKVGIPRISSGVFKECLWTVAGLLPFPDEVQVPRLQVDASKPAVPTDLFSDFRINMLLDQMVDQEDQSLEYFDGSLSKNTKTIPLFDETVLDIMSITCNPARSRFLPAGVERDNIGSNVGLIRTLLRLKEEYAGSDKYVIVLADINIYKRIFKVN